MKKIVVLSILTASMMYATNGDNMMGVGVQSRAMGGTGIGQKMGTDSVFRNPAWLVDEKGFKASFGATAFMPTVKAKVGPKAGLGNGQWGESKSDFSIIPTVSFSNNINENLSYGVGMFGVSGMGVDYRNEDPKKGLANMRTALQYMRFVPSISYKINDLRIGASLSMAYGALSMSALTPSDPTNPATAAQRGGGISEDIAFGGQLGLGYNITSGITVGAYYQSEIETEYEDVFDFDAGNMNNGYDDLTLSQPAEAGIGFGYTSSCGCYGASLDYRRIMWSDAAGYDAFGWDDQDVIAVGASYNATSDLVLRAGYNYSKSPLNEKGNNFKATTVGGAPFQPFNVAYFNALGFPAYTESHITAGFSYDISPSTGIDFAYVYAPEVTEKTMQVLEASNEQTSASLGLRYSF
jgi:long-chain fatty acid transport protein